MPKPVRSPNFTKSTTSAPATKTRLQLYTGDKPQQLAATDLANLEQSGLTLATIKANGLHTAGNALVFPYRRLDGTADGFTRTRPHEPRVNAKGKPVKYEQPKGVTPRAYFPVGSLKKLRDGKTPIYVTEGEKKALALSQLWLAAIGIGGIWNWKKKDTEELIADLAAVKWKGRIVYIVFDYEEKPKTQQDVNQATSRLADALRLAGASEVYGVELLPGPGDKQGVDDFLVTDGADEFKALVAKARPVPAAKLSLLHPSGRTDAANAQRFATKFRESVRWVGEWDKWLVWDGHRWSLDKALRIEHLGKQVANDIFRETAKVAKEQRPDREVMGAIYSFAKLSNSAKGIRDMLSLVRSVPGIAIAHDQLDVDPMLLNVENGTLDLQSGKLRPHRRDELLTKLAPVTFDSDATCPTWLAFLNKIFDGNGELIGYLQRLAGCSLTGSTQEHVLPFLYGTGANGKSTFIETLMKLFGKDYAMKAAPDLLMMKRGESHPTDRADLFGKRLVACVETEDGRRMAEALVKEMTGGDTMRARRMREDFWEFVPTHHVWLAGNHKPTVKGNDHGIWRRVKLIPFDVVIPDGEQDKKLPSKLAAELPGILNWALAGCLEWQANGLQEPAIVRDATNEYAAEMDDVGQFIEEHCQLGPYLTPATELFDAYRQAMPKSNITPQSFGTSLARRGFTRKRITSGPNKARHGWQGLRLRPDTDAERAGGFAAYLAKRKPK